MPDETTAPTETDPTTTAPPAEAASAPGSITETLAAAAATPAPIDYSGLRLPDGYALEDAALADFRTILAEHQVPLAAAEKVLEFQATLQLAAKNAADAADTAVAEAGLAELKADKEFGGAKLAENMGRASRVLTEFWGKETAEALLSSKLLNHAGFTRGLLRVAAATAEAPLVSSSSSNPVDAARARWPNSPGMWQ